MGRKGFINGAFTHNNKCKTIGYWPTLLFKSLAWIMEIYAEHFLHRDTPP